MATCIYNPPSGTFTDQSTGLPIVPGPADSRFYGNAVTPYSLTATNGLTAGLIMVSGDASFAVASGDTVNAPIDDNGAKLVLGTAGATTTGASPYQYGSVSLAGNVDTPSPAPAPRSPSRCQASPPPARSTVPPAPPRSPPAQPPCIPTSPTRCARRGPARRKSPAGPSLRHFENVS